MGIIYDYLLDLQHKGVLTLPLNSNGNPILESAEADKYLRLLTNSSSIVMEGLILFDNNHISNDYNKVVLSTAASKCIYFC